MQSQKYIPFSKQDRLMASKVDLVSFLQLRGEKLERVGKEYKLIYTDSTGKTYTQIPYTPNLWRNGEQLPTLEGLIVGCNENVGSMTALVDDSDIHTLMIGASGVGKTANFLYPNIEYCCAAGMSFVAIEFCKCESALR